MEDARQKFQGVMHMTFAKEEPSSSTEIGIRPFQPGDAAAFRRLNEEWITRFFRIELKEKPVLADPQTNILDSGGRILFATVGERCVGCCALIRINDKEFEVAKMAVGPSYQGVGIGRRLLHAAIEERLSAGAQRLYLETNHVLTPAIRLYESMGFKHIDPNRIVPPIRASRCVHGVSFGLKAPCRTVPPRECHVRVRLTAMREWRC
jgi:putative acetyltransferase